MGRPLFIHSWYSASLSDFSNIQHVKYIHFIKHGRKVSGRGPHVVNF